MEIDGRPCVKIFLLVLSMIFPLAGSFSLSELNLAFMGACPCPDEVLCIPPNSTTFTCVKLFNIDACQDTFVSGIAECVPCVNAGLQWCQMDFFDTNSAVCATNCTFFSTQFPDLFPNEPVTCTDQCPKKLVCPDCVSDDNTEVKIVICHKPDTPAEKTLKVPLVALESHLDHGDVIGACKHKNGNHRDDDDDDRHGNGRHNNYDDDDDDGGGNGYHSKREPSERLDSEGNERPAKNDSSGRLPSIVYSSVVVILLAMIIGMM